MLGVADIQHKKMNVRVMRRRMTVLDAQRNFDDV
jgi:hypothetical protein